MDSIEIYFSFLTFVLAIAMVCTIVSDTIITTDNSISVLFWCCMPGLNVIVAAWMIYHLTKLIPVLSIKETVQSCLRPPWKERK